MRRGCCWPTTQVDSLLVIFIPPLVTKADDVAQSDRGGCGGCGEDGARELHQQPRCASRARADSLVSVSGDRGHGAGARRPAMAPGDGGHRASFPMLPDIHADVARDIVDGALRRGDGWLIPDESQRLSAPWGSRRRRARLVTSDEDAVAAAREIGYPVVLKAAGPEILHKSDVGGVVLGLGDDAAVRSAFRELASRLGRTMTGALVQQMVPGGVEFLVGGVVDPTFGPLVACGSGGVLVDLLADTAFRLHPLTDLAAAEMVDGLKSVRLLRGYRGHPPADEHAVVDTLLRVSALMAIAPEIQELDINPLKVLERGVMRPGRARARQPERRPRPRESSYFLLSRIGRNPRRDAAHLQRLGGMTDGEGTNTGARHIVAPRSPYAEFASVGPPLIETWPALRSPPPHLAVNAPAVRITHPQLDVPALSDLAAIMTL